MSITDRAKRYRANQDIEDDKRLGCLFCGSHRFLVPDHLDGNEDNGGPDNLAWLCKSCNTVKGRVFADAGVGRLTEQFNPSFLDLFSGGRRRASSEPEGRHGFKRQETKTPFLGIFGGRSTSYTREKGGAVRSGKSGGAGDRTRRSSGRERESYFSQVQRRAESQRRKQDAANERRERAEEKKRAAAEKREAARLKPRLVTTFRGERIYKSGDVYTTSFDRGSEFDSLSDVKALIKSYKSNPAGGARTVQEWGNAVGTVLGQIPGSVRLAARRIAATAPDMRRRLAARLKQNPGDPTYQQYAWAVSQGGPHGHRIDTQSAHDEAGAVIHATSEAKRKEYAARIAAAKRERGTDRRGGLPL